jgi:5-formyltetrahydrofolate cyclo-ligase
MIFDSLGLGELGVVAILGILLMDPKKLGSMVRQVAEFRRKVNQIQNQVRNQINTLVLDDEMKEKKSSIPDQKVLLRNWGKEQVEAFTAQQKHEKSKIITEAILSWPVFQQAQSLCAFVGRLDEVDTDSLLQAALKAGKTVYLPWIENKEMRFCRIRDLQTDLADGHFGILEPLASLRQGPNGSEEMQAQARKADLTLVPGVTYDGFGGRIGHGKGYYDRHLAQAETFTLGVVYDSQIHTKKLPLEAHDRRVEAIVTESRFLLFSEPRLGEKPSTAKEMGLPHESSE